MPAHSVMNPRSRHSSRPGKGRAEGEVTTAAGVSGASPSGLNPIVSGVRENTRSASNHIVMTVTTAITDAASEKPKPLMATTHSGEKTIPPTLPPL
jgi:hypothetical protein